MKLKLNDAALEQVYKQAQEKISAAYQAEFARIASTMKGASISDIVAELQKVVRKFDGNVDKSELEKWAKILAEGGKIDFIA